MGRSYRQNTKKIVMALEKKYKDLVGQDVYIGDKIAIARTLSGSIYFSVSTIKGFTKTGRAITEGNASTSKFVKILEQ